MYLAKVLHAIEIGLDRKEITTIDASAILIIANKYKDDFAELKKSIEAITSQFPALKEVAQFEKEETTENFEDIVQKYITFLIQNGRATEVATFSEASKKLNNSTQDLFAQYPEITNLI